MSQEKTNEQDAGGVSASTVLLDLLRGVDAAELYNADGTLPEHKIRIMEAAKYAYITRQQFAAAAKLRDAEKSLKGMWEADIYKWGKGFLESGWDGNDWNAERMKELIGALRAEMEAGNPRNNQQSNLHKTACKPANLPQI